VLGAAFIHPVLTSAVRDGADAAAALACAGLLMALRWPPITVVAAGAAFGLARPTLGL